MYRQLNSHRPDDPTLQALQQPQTSVPRVVVKAFLRGRRWDVPFRLSRSINHLLTYLLTYVETEAKQSLVPRRGQLDQGKTSQGT